jgi:hypothetical protein
MGPAYRRCLAASVFGAGAPECTLDLVATCAAFLDAAAAVAHVYAQWEGARRRRCSARTRTRSGAAPHAPGDALRAAFALAAALPRADDAFELAALAGWLVPVARDAIAEHLWCAAPPEVQAPLARIVAAAIDAAWVGPGDLADVAQWLAAAVAGFPVAEHAGVARRVLAAMAVPVEPIWSALTAPSGQ